MKHHGKIRKALNTLDKIIHTAESMFKKYGIRSVTMADLARALGMSKKTLYVYVENKQDLVDKVVQYFIQQDQHQMHLILEAGTNALETMLKVGLRVQQDIQDMNPSLIFDLQKYHYSTWLYIEKFHKEFIYKTIIQNLHQGIEEGLYRSNLNPEIISRLYVSTIPVFSDLELFPINRFSRLNLHNEFVNYHLFGIVSDKGRKLLNTYLNAL